MSANPVNVIVTQIEGPLAVASVDTPDQQAALRQLGFTEDSEAGRFSLDIASNEDRRRLLVALAAIDALFVDAAGWSPAEYARLYRDEVDPAFTFRSIAWHGRDDWRIVRE